MTKLNIISILIVMVAAFAAPRTLYGQSNNIEINLDVLDKIVGSPSEPIPDNMPAVSPARVEAAETISKEIKNLIPETPLLPPKPGRKPAFISQDILKELAGVDQSTPPATFQKQEEVKTKSDATAVPVPEVTQELIVEEPVKDLIPEEDLPPLPPKRPSVIHASKSFVENAIKNLSSPKSKKPAPSKQVKEKRPSSSNPVVASDPLGKELVDPSVEDILASIDPDEINSTKVSKVSDENIISLGYMPGVSELPADIKEELQSKITPKIKNNSQGRVEIVAYATTPDNNPATARRLSLARALEIRGLLIEQDVEPTRIDVRPMGDNTDITPRDRVDIQFVK